MVPLGQKPKDFCGATQLGDCSPTRRRANTRLSLVTGEKPVGPYWGNPVQSALRGPFDGAPSAAIPPPAALLERRKSRVLLRVIGLFAVNLG